jgi:hypothetical protein
MLSDLPVQVIESSEYESALATLKRIAQAFAAGGWDFLAACQEADQSVER